MASLEKTRRAQKAVPPGRAALHTGLVFLFGAGLGLFAKYLDHRQGQLPGLLQALDEALDLHNFLGRFSPWVLIAVCLALYSRSALRAALHVFVFFVGMVASYYAYSKLAAGFFSASYALIWVGFTALSPLAAFVCWYAKGEGHAALLLSSLLMAVFFNMAFAFGWGYLDLRSGLELLVLAGAAAALRRERWQGTLLMAALGAGLAPVLNGALPYWMCLW